VLAVPGRRLWPASRGWRAGDTCDLMHPLQRLAAVPSAFWAVLIVLGVGVALGAVVVGIQGWLGPAGFGTLGAAGFGLVALARLAQYRFQEQPESRRVARLAAGLEAQARLQTARAIQEVNFDQTAHEREPGGADAKTGPASDLSYAAGEAVEGTYDPPTVFRQEREGIAGAVDRFYAEALLQSRVWFLASVLAAGVGLAVIVWEVVQATNQPALDAVLKTVPGLLTGAIAALFYRQANATRKHAADLLTSTQGDRRAETARQILGTMQDDGWREEIAARLAMHFAGAPASQRRRSAARGRNARPDGAPVRRSQKVAAEPEQEGVE
jgi:Cyanobacterial TRADD-N associated 2-Transmembrane domain